MPPSLVFIGLAPLSPVWCEGIMGIVWLLCVLGIPEVLLFLCRCSIGRNIFVLLTVATRGGIGRTLAGHDGLCAEKPCHSLVLNVARVGRGACLEAAVGGRFRLARAHL